MLSKKGVYFANHYAENASLYLDYILFDAIIYLKHIFYLPKIGLFCCIGNDTVLCIMVEQKHSGSY